MTKRKRARSTGDLVQAPREQLITQIMRGLTRGKMRQQVAWVLEVTEAAHEFRIGELEGMAAFIRRLGENFRAHCPHAFETWDPRCLRCGEPNEAYIPPAGEADATLPPSGEVH